MATDLATPSNTTAKMRWKELYVSEGLNKKLNGIIPAGVVRGGRLTVSGVDMTVTIEADPDTGDSIYSFIDTNGHQITFRQAGDVSLNLAAVASTTVRIALEIVYSTSADTVVEWRAFSQAEIDADPTLVVLGGVVVPASGAIAASAITPEGRREAWTNTAPQMREWRQVVKEGDFGSLGDSGGSVTINTTSVLPAWKTDNLGTFTWTVETTDPYVGDYHLKVEDAVTGSDYLSSLEVFKCQPGSLLHVFYAVQGIDMVSVGASGEYGVHLFFYDEDRQYIASDIIVTDNTLTGTFGWTEVEKVVEAPANASFFKYALYLNTDGVAFGATTVLYFDAIRVFAQADRATDGHDGGYIQDEAGQFVAMDIAPEIGTYSDLEERNDRAVRMESGGFASGIIQLLMGAKGGDAFRQTLTEGILRLTNAQTALSASVPRIETDVPGSEPFVLFWQSDDLDGFTFPVRIYHGPATGDFAGFIVTTNAYWDGSTWERDQSANSAMFVLSGSSFTVFTYGAGSSSPWASSAWDTSIRADGDTLDITGNIQRDFVSSSDYQLIWDNVHETTGPHIRLYVNNYGLSITSNASFNAGGGVWNRDWNFDDSMLFRVASTEIAGWKVESTASDGWSSWTTSGKKMFDFGSTLGSFEGNIDINNGNLDVEGYIDVDGNPAPTDMVANRLFAKSIVKAFGGIQTDASPIIFDDSMNIATAGVTYVGSNVIITFDVALLDDKYSVVAMVADEYEFPIWSSTFSSTTAVTIGVCDSFSSQTDLSTVARYISFVVFGEM